MHSAELSRLQQYFDGELDAGAATQVELHLASCAECQRELRHLEQMRRLLSGPAARIGLPSGFRDGIEAALDREEQLQAGRPRQSAGVRSGPFWLGVLSGIGGSAVAAALAFLFLIPLLDNPLPNELVGDHIRSLMSSHLTDVVSTDQHTVKPWFSGRTDVSPEVADFAAQGYRLLGGRVEVLARQRAAVLVYQHGAHFIDVYAWNVPTGRVPRDTIRRGYRMVFWKEGDLGYCAISDAGWTELRSLTALIQELAARDRPR